jgi:hypothetical protein
MATDGPIRRVFGVKTPDPETRRSALDDPGASWQEWFYFEFAKVWILLGFFVGDSIAAVSFADPFDPALMLSVLFLLSYLEFLAYRCLWFRPDPEKEWRFTEFRPSWLRPVRFGRWTPEAFRLRQGRSAFEEAQVGPDPAEFL